eukprot:7825110-Alexandrium_andersonii.AAC.1
MHMSILTQHHVRPTARVKARALRKLMGAFSHRRTWATRRALGRGPRPIGWTRMRKPARGARTA